MDKEGIGFGSISGRTPAEPLGVSTRDGGPPRSGHDGSSGLGTHWATFHRISGGSMRIGIRLAGALAGVSILAMVATIALGAAASEEVKHVPLGGSLTGQTGDR